ncbi:hypothetical protein VOLCADRAFT_97147 [Volvox carteri f. nagariensis]|uniref:Protein kinase domain-containing protein n=1 Tax=Volvox carteri f. nagariensis TaxID=3068 RepID=D8UC02_VOLCA|nr:uncharacterized protein VOLCADRAFT_97147 [Volvox carteri f. nagariensis]EFJ42761.1 hypothetical protein VOLCADRAFT_97147 [Volvox carteri f. nagariensis]|eukprot:XP_002956222.1 hypothetical protein VOLCADRAFT_97147 [Volvox carteri f. nagariensis]
MRKRNLSDLVELFVVLNIVFLVTLPPLVASTVLGNASSSKDFFVLLSQPGIQRIILNNDISLDLEDAPTLPVNLTANLTIVAGLPWPQVASLAANYIASKIRLAPFVTLTFERIILSGTLRGTGQYLDLLTRSDGGAVLYNLSINHRHACLPFDLFYEQLNSLPQPQPDAGMPINYTVSNDRGLILRNSTLCWLNAGMRNTCMAPYLDVYAYGAYNQKIDGVIGNGGYNSFFVHSYGVCDREISRECIKQTNADLCLAAALALGNQVGSSDGADDEEAASTMRLAIGLGVGLGGALLVLMALFAWAHWRHRREASLAAFATPSARSKAALSTATQGTLPADLAGLEEGSGEGIRSSARKPNGGAGVTVAGVGGSGAAASAAEAHLVAGDGDAGGGGKGRLTAGATVGSTGATGSSSNGSSRSSSGVTIEASSVTNGGQRTAGSECAGSAGLGEVEAARLNLLANAARGRAGRGRLARCTRAGIWHGTLVALKAQVLPPSLSGDARRRHMAVMEAAISSAINHPAIVQTYCYSFRPIKDTVGQTIIKHRTKSFPIREEEPEKEDEGQYAAGDGTGGEEGCEEGGEDYGHELLLVLEYCDGGSLRAALDKGLFHQGRPWPWDWRKAIQAAGQAATAGAQGGKLPQLERNQMNQPAAAAASATSTPAQGDTTAIANLVAAMTRGSNSLPPANTLDGQHRRSGQGAAVDSSAAQPPQPQLPAPCVGGDDREVADGAGGGGGGSGGDNTSCQGSATSRTVKASDLASSAFPKLDTYEPDFTHGAFEVILPATDDDAAAGGDGDDDGGGSGGAAVPPQSAPQPSSHLGGTTLNVVNTLAGAPTAAMSFVSSFNNASGIGASTADNAAAAAAADRLAMMYLLQQAAATVAAGADPVVGSYAKMLTDYISSSNITGMNAIMGELASFGAVSALQGPAAVTSGGGGAAVSHSSDGTLVAPPPPVLASTVAAPAAMPSPAAARSALAGGSSPPRSHASLLRMASSSAASSEAGPQQAPQPAIRYVLMLAVAADVASGLLHLHAHGVVHGDVKASNVLLKQIVVSDPLEAAGRALDTMSYGAGGVAASTAPLSAGPSAVAAAAAAAAAAGLGAAGAGAGAGTFGGAFELQRDGSIESSGRGPRLGLCAKVSDFGLSTMLSASNTDTHISATTAAGSLSHMSPELLLCGHVSKANDVYAYGVLLFELFTGERAWEGMPRALLPARVALEGWRPVFPPHTPAAYRQLAERCWLADPAKRPTFEEVVAVLKDLRDAAASEMVPEWLPVPNPQMAFLQQLAMQRRLPGALLSPATQQQQHLQAAVAAAVPSPQQRVRSAGLRAPHPLGRPGGLKMVSARLLNTGLNTGWAWTKGYKQVDLPRMYVCMYVCTYVCMYAQPLARQLCLTVDCNSYRAPREKRHTSQFPNHATFRQFTYVEVAKKWLSITRSFY